MKIFFLYLMFVYNFTTINSKKIEKFSDNKLCQQYTEIMKNTEYRCISLQDSRWHFIQSDIYYKRYKNKLHSIKLESLFFWSFLPNVNYTYSPAIIGSKNVFSIDISLNNIIESIMKDILSYDEKQIIYDIENYYQELILSFEDLVCSVIQKISELRARYRILQYLYKELEKKIEIMAALEEEHLEDIFIIKGEILKTSVELIEIEKDLQELIVKSNGTIDNKYINNIHYIFNNLFVILKQNRTNIKEFNFNNINVYISKKNLIFKQPIPPKNYLFFTKFFIDGKFNFTFDKDEWSFLLSFKPIEYINHIIQSVFAWKSYKLTLQEQLEKWDKKKRNREIRTTNLIEEIKLHQDTLVLMYQLLKNEYLLSTLKIKRVIHNRIITIIEEEKIIGNSIVQYIQKSITLN